MRDMPQRETSAAAWRFLALLPVAFTVLAARVQAGETAPCGLEKYIDEGALHSVVTAPDEGTLTRLWRDRPHADSVLRAAYAWRHLELSPGEEAEEGFLRALPTSRLEFDFLWAVGDTQIYKKSEPVQTFVLGYFRKAARLAAHHPEHIKTLLLLNQFADGEARDFVAEAIEALKGLNKKDYLDTLRKLDSATRQAVCGDCPDLRKGSE